MAAEQNENLGNFKIEISIDGKDKAKSDIEAIRAGIRDLNQELANTAASGKKLADVMKDIRTATHGGSKKGSKAEVAATSQKNTENKSAEVAKGGKAKGGKEASGGIFGDLINAVKKTKDAVTLFADAMVKATAKVKDVTASIGGVNKAIDKVVAKAGAAKDSNAGGKASKKGLTGLSLKEAKKGIDNNTAAMDAHAPKVKADTKAMGAHTPKVTADTDAFKLHTPRVKSDTTAIGAHTPKVTADTDAFKLHTPAVKADTKAMGAHTPKVTADADAFKLHTPKVKADTKAMGTHTPVVRDDTKAIKAHTPKVTADTDAFKLHTPTVTADTKAMGTHTATLGKMGTAVEDVTGHEIKDASGHKTGRYTGLRGLSQGVTAANSSFSNLHKEGDLLFATFKALLGENTITRDPTTGKVTSKTRTGTKALIHSFDSLSKAAKGAARNLEAIAKMKMKMNSASPTPGGDKESEPWFKFAANQDRAFKGLQNFILASNLMGSRTMATMANTAGIVSSVAGFFKTNPVLAAIGATVGVGAAMVGKHNDMAAQGRSKIQEQYKYKTSLNAAMLDIAATHREAMRNRMAYAVLDKDGNIDAEATDRAAHLGVARQNESFETSKALFETRGIEAPWMTALANQGIDYTAIGSREELKQLLARRYQNINKNDRDAVNQWRTLWAEAGGEFSEEEKQAIVFEGGKKEVYKRDKNGKTLKDKDGKKLTETKYFEAGLKGFEAYSQAMSGDEASLFGKEDLRTVEQRFGEIVTQVPELFDKNIKKMKQSIEAATSDFDLIMRKTAVIIADTELKFRDLILKSGDKLAKAIDWIAVKMELIKEKMDNTHIGAEEQIKYKRIHEKHGVKTSKGKSATFQKGMGLRKRMLRELGSSTPSISSKNSVKGKDHINSDAEQTKETNIKFDNKKSDDSLEGLKRNAGDGGVEEAKKIEKTKGKIEKAKKIVKGLPELAFPNKFQHQKAKGKDIIDKVNAREETTPMVGPTIENLNRINAQTEWIEQEKKRADASAYYQKQNQKPVEINMNFSGMTPQPVLDILQSSEYKREIQDVTNAFLEASQVR